MAFGFHTENRVWGAALNPYDHSRTCGGSSGGDAGLISTRCVPFSVCSDIGGSIQDPCSFHRNMWFQANSLEDFRTRLSYWEPRNL
jgi:Asp-tRNA(Asn)/Glu-tRNA(Gln) amidotransferase A subunit family amidase